MSEGFSLEAELFEVGSVSTPNKIIPIEEFANSKSGFAASAQSYLAAAGFNCELNTTEAIADIGSDVIKSVPTSGTAMVSAAPKSGAKDYDYVIENDSPIFSKMSTLLANIDKLEAKGLVYVGKHDTVKNFESDTLSAIKEIFTAAGRTIGSVQSGHIDPEQMATLLGGILEGFSDTEEKDFEQKNTDVMLLLPKGAEGSSPIICGVWYSYTFTVKDYKKKNKQHHQSHCDVHQKNIVFTDPKVFNDVYHKTINQV